MEKLKLKMRFMLAVIPAMLLAGCETNEAGLPVLGDVLGALDPSAPIVAAVLMVLEVVLRLIKSDKVRSIMRLVAAVTRQVGALVERLAELLDRVVPDRTSES